MGKQFRVLLLAALPLVIACATTRLTEVPLGSVVVYRNGVAFFERFARVHEGELTLMIAESKVDDLLKSLTVRDAETGKALPITFPAREAGNGLVRMTVRVVGTKTRKVKLSYVSESPAWKPSYRLSLGSDGEVELQGWAIVDNVSGEDWNKVKVGVGTTSALAFRYDLWSVRDVKRQTLGHKERLATAPPTATGLVDGPVDQPDDTARIDEVVTLDSSYTQNIPVPGRSFASVISAAAGANGDNQGVSFSGSSSLENQYVIDGVDASSVKWVRRSAKELEDERKRKEYYLRGKQHLEAENAKSLRRNDELARQLLSSEGDFIIEGIASPSERNSQAVALSMANHLRNQLINRNVPPGRLTVKTRVGAVGEPTTLKVTPRQGEQADDHSSSSVGESKFMSATSVSIPNKGSSMVPVVDQKTAGGVVYLYDALSPRGNKRFAFKSIRFRNPTEKFLEAGPITVFGDGAFIGEGLTDAIAPGASTILPYALDKLVYVDRGESFRDKVIGFAGVLTEGAIVEKERTSTVRYSIHNRSHNPVTVYVRHDTNRGWKLKRGPENLEQLGRMSVFPVKLGAGERQSFEVVEATPVTATLDLTTDAAVEALAGYLRSLEANPKFAESATRLVDAHRSIRRKLHQIDDVAGQLAIYRGRLDDLHVQVVTLQAVGSKGRLARNLRGRMDDMSKRAQSAIIEIVELREEIMLERFAYRDLVTGLGELHP